MSLNPTKRFSHRVDNYVKYRPSYPTAVLTCLRDECGLEETAVIADIGSGTGILARLFLQNGNRVLGVEPNKEMREAGEAFLAEFRHFTSINGTAEATAAMASNATATTVLDTAVPVESVLNEEMNTDTAVTQEQPAVPTGQNFVDEDGDGVCDTCGNVPGSGMGNQYGKGAMGSNFVDEDGDGVCDACGLAPADGTGNQYGRQGGAGGQGRGGRGNN